MKHLTFLEEGEYTQRDDLVREIAKELRKSDHSQRRAVSRYVAKNLKLDESRKQELFRKRTASEVLESGFVTGCTDVGLAFIVLARELGIPTRYVETFYEPWLESNGSGIDGHVFVDVLIEGKWLPYEPKRGFMPNNVYQLDRGKYIEVGKGLDFSAVYLKDNGVYRAEPVNLQSLNVLLETARRTNK